MNSAGYLFAVIAGWSVLEEAILGTGIGNWVLRQGIGLQEEKSRKPKGEIATSARWSSSQ